MEEEIRKEFMEMIKLLDEGKLQEFKQKATECPPVDIAEGLEEIEDEGRVLRVFRMLPKDISSDVFSYMTSPAAAGDTPPPAPADPARTGAART